MKNAPRESIYLASFIWPEADEALCAGSNKKIVMNQAYKLAKERYGNSLVSRGSAMCSCKIQRCDIRIEEIVLV